LELILKSLISRIILLVSFCFGMVVISLAQDAPKRPYQRPVHTYSIVACDSVTGQMGVAVQSHWFSVGPIVPWAKAGVGAVATQSLVDVSYGPLGLQLMQAGRTAGQALAALTTADQHADIRQVAMVDVNGNVAVHTGEKCIPAAGHLIGNGFSVQANLMLNENVWPAMKAAYENSEGDLAARMLAALEAAEAAGGDIRGKQSAAMIIVSAESTGKPWQDTILDLRVEDDPEPLRELRRLVKLHRAYEHMNRGDLAIEQNDAETALREYGLAQSMFPDNLEMKFWHAVSLVNIDRIDDALPIFEYIFKRDKNWATLIPRLRTVGILPDETSVINKILSVSSQQ
jgi:uncharacterized Ntn-hydrolase superfamily protein